MTVDTPEVDRFVRTFQDFLDRVMRGPLAGADNELVRRLRDHLGEDPLTLPVAEGQWDPFELVNVHRGLLACLERDGRHSELLGVGGGSHGAVEGLAGLVEAAQRHRAVDVGPVQRQAVATSATTTEVVVATGLFLAVVDGLPMAVLLAGAHPNRGREKVTVDVMCAVPEAAGAFLDEVRDEAVVRSVFRGQVISFDASGFGHELGPVRFRPRPSLDRADLVLPSGILELVERQVLDIGRHRQRLRDSGQHLKRGVLLHGPPGTGKTHTVRYLLSRLTGVTVVLLAGQGLRFIGPACALARMLQPAVVVLEDCDLVAEDRSFSFGPQPLLFDVLNELDGIAEDVDVAFLLTTNRADLLEPALAARPGRVDQAVEIPLPDTAARRELFALYSRGLTLAEDVDLDAVAEGTAGATASLLKELARRATLYALDETGTPPPQAAGQPGSGVAVNGRHVTAALDDLTRGASDLTRRLLGRPEDEPVIETVEPMLGEWRGDLPGRARPGRGRMPPGPGLVER